MPPTDCPTPDTLRAFHFGDLAEAVLLDVATHLEDCPACEAAAQTLDHLTDPVVAAYRRSANGFPAPAAVPARVGEHEILGEIGRGGMGVVYKARHRRLGRVVAIKMLLRGAYAEPEEKARFRAEAEAVARLQQPNIVQLHEVGEHDAGDGQPRPYITLEFVDGESLSARMAGRPQPPRQAAAWVEAVARAVQFAHDRGVVHRDLKPSNILLAADGQPKLCDFGVAKLLTGSDLKTLSGAVLGTIEYMAPEQAAGDAAVGPPADIYALGAILYTALTGRPPFQGTNALLTLEQVRQQEPVAPRLLVPLVPRDLNTICLKCLEKKPGSRYPSAAALADDVHRFLAGEPIVARPVTAWERAWKWARRRPAVAGLLALSLAVLVVGFPGAMTLWLRADRARAAADATRDQLEGAVYAGHIALADHAYQDNEIAAAAELLGQCRPAPGRPDRRNWEWRYLTRLCQADLVPGLGHADKPDHWVFALAFHPGGQALVSAAGLPGGALAGHPANASKTTPGDVRAWDPQTGRRLATLGGHVGALRAAAFSPDGRWLATGSADGHVRLRDGRTFADCGEIATAPQGVQNLSFTIDGRCLVVSSGRDVVALEVPEGRRRFTFAESWRAVSPALAIGPDDHVAFGGVDAGGRPVVELRDLKSGKEVGHHVSGEPAAALALSPDRRLLALAGPADHRIQIWDADGGTRLRQLAGHTNEVIAMAFCPDGRLVSAGDDRTVRVWDPKTGTEVCQFRGHRLGVQSLAVSPDGRRLASGDKLGDVKLWDQSHNPRGVAFQAVTGGGEYLDHLSFSGDSNNIMVVADKNGDVDVHDVTRWDASTGHLQDRRPFRPAVRGEHSHRAYAFSGDGRKLAGVDGADLEAVAVYDPADGSRLAAFRVPGGASVPSLDEHGDRIAYGGWLAAPAKQADSAADPSVRADLVVADCATGREIFRPVIPAGHIITPVTVSADGRRLASAVRAVTLSGQTVTRVPTTSVYVWTLPGSAGGQSTAPLILDEAFHGAIACLAFSPDGDRLAAAALDGTVGVWAADTGRPVFAPVQEPRAPTSLVFSPDGRRLAGACTDGLVHLWDADRGDRLLTLRGLGPPGNGHYGFTARVAFSRDGSRLAANDWDGTVTIWDASPPGP